MLLVDQPINNRTITEYISITKNAHAANIILLTFGYYQTNTTIESYVITNLNTTVTAVMNYYQ